MLHISVMYTLVWYLSYQLKKTLFPEQPLKLQLHNLEEILIALIISFISF